MQENKKENEQWMLLILSLNKLRVQKEISINKLSEISNIPQPHISRFFSCKFEPKLGTYLKFEKIIKNICTTK